LSELQTEYDELVGKVVPQNSELVKRIFEVLSLKHVGLAGELGEDEVIDINHALPVVYDTVKVLVD